MPQTQAAGVPPEGRSTGEPTLTDVLLLFLRARKLLLRCAVGGMAALLAYAGLRPAWYTVSATFLPQVPQGNLSALAGVAAQFGVGLPGDDPSQSPAFYMALLGSNAILGPLADSMVDVDEDGTSHRESLATLWHLANSATPSDVVRQLTILELGKRLTAKTDRQTGLVTVTLTDRHPEVAAQVVGRAIALVNDFNVSSRQSQARSESAFIATRVDTARADLDAAIGRLQVFLTQNRDFHGSPALQFEHDRLAQDVDNRQNLLTTLQQSYEQSRIDRVRNTPVITVVEPARRPPVADRRRWGFHLLLGGFLGTFVGLVILVATRWWAAASQGDPLLAEEAGRALSSLVGPLQRFRRSRQR